MVALIGILAFFDVKISARVLGVALIGEVLVLTIFDVLVFGQGGENIQAAALNPVNAFKNLPAGSLGGTDIAAGAWAVGVFFAFWSWVGFEMAPNYGEESRDPEEDRPPGHVRLGRRPGHLLHHHLLGRALRLRLDGRRRRAGPDRSGGVLPRSRRSSSATSCCGAS